ncbi:uncharacterized protein B0H18DRAFT_1022325 [Fomitopsis serialis]|uniref:uncharacterized protein n=1 Tax=Fomitopsis serialis TaxID=139415 RepID=UPI0020082222|nr:uncharacterized protein B0H18DRAFT_1022325 [Neoantrodia serialis]KAH9921020.1 hypothetical protein B0H18DRAFT_1022325 [Neoantrodia serialis]
MRRSAVRAAGVLAFAASNALLVAGDNTTCPGPLLDWYMNYVGETPCMTYQRLRQLCDAKYTVPLFRKTAPGDQCDTQFSACCCNSVAWSLSMLCMNCQEHAVSNGSGSIEAPVGGYYKYRFANATSHTGYCGDGSNGTLPSQVQSAVCNSNIKIADWLYPDYFPDGSWFYTNFMNQAQLNQTSSNNNTFTHCNSTNLANNSSSSSSLPSATSQSQGTTSSAPASSVTTGTVAGAVKSSSSNTGAIAGGTVGGVLGLLLILLGVAVFMRKRKAAANVVAGARSGDVPPLTAVEQPRAPNQHGVVPYDVPEAYPYAVLGRPISGKHGIFSPPSATNLTSATSASGTMHTRTDSTSNMSSDMRQTNTFTMPVVLEPEQDAGRLTALRPPPAYRSSWDDRG